MAQGVAWAARELGVPATVVVPEHAPQTKLDAIARLGGQAVQVPFEEWWQVIVDTRFAGAEGLFVHPVQDDARHGRQRHDRPRDRRRTCPTWTRCSSPSAAAGSSPASPARSRRCGPRAKVFAVEAETGAPLAASLAAGEPRAIEYTPDVRRRRGRAGRSWRRCGRARAACSPARSRCRSTRSPRRSACWPSARGSSPRAPGRSPSPRRRRGRVPGERIVCIVSGGNIDAARLAAILRGETPA